MTKEQRHQEMNQFVYILQTLESALLTKNGKEAISSRIAIMKLVAKHILGRDYKMLEKLMDNPELLIDNPEHEVEA